MQALIRFFVENKLVVAILLALMIAAGVSTAPFAEFDDFEVTRAPVAVDAIPDIGENQQIIFTRWDGRSPRDIEDQVTYPLTTALLGMPGVRTVRKEVFPTELVYGGKDLGSSTLRLITCSMFDPDIGTHVGNTVVFASLSDVTRS